MTEPPEPAAPTAADPSAPPAHRPGSSLGVGWPAALLGALLTAVAGLLVAEAIVLLLGAAASGSTVPAAVLVRAGGVLFYEFHHVGIVLEIPRNALPAAGALPFFSERFGVAVAGLSGTLLVAWLLARFGRRIGEEAGGTGWHRSLAGAKIGLPYALLVFVGGFALRTSFAYAGGRVRLHPSYLGSLLWPLGIGLVAGFLGGARSAGAQTWGATAWGGRFRAAFAGGVRTMSIGLGLGFVALLGLAVARPHATAAYFGAVFRDGAAFGVGLLLLNLLAVPNLSAWVLFPSMGACVGAFGDAGGVSFGYCVLSYSRFPGAVAGAASSPLGIGPQLGHPPAVYYLFVLVPAVAVVLGGALAARRSASPTRGEAALVGAMAGVAFGLMGLVVAALSVLSAHAAGIVGGPAGGATLRLGPDIVPSFVLALAWGIVGGALGGLAEGRSLPLRTAEPEGSPPAAGSGY